MNSLTTPTRLSRKWKCELLRCVCVCACLRVRVHVCMRCLAMEAVGLGEYFKLDYVELFSMKEDV